MELLFGMTFAKFKLIISKHCVINRIRKNEILISVMME